MHVEYHPSVRQDVTEATQRYKAVSQKLADDFKAELRRVVAMASANPNRFHSLKAGIHRANLKRFPYHFIYREITTGIRVILVRHHRRHPDMGMDRH
jgi:plasmid stabilization system protein ParE